MTNDINSCITKTTPNFLSIFSANKWPIVEQILHNLDTVDCGNLASTCKQFNNIIHAKCRIYKMSPQDIFLYYISQNNIEKIHEHYNNLRNILSEKKLLSILELACLESVRNKNIQTFRIIYSWLGTDIKNMEILVQLCKIANLEIIKILETYTNISLIHDAVIASNTINRDVCKYICDWRNSKKYTDEDDEMYSNSDVDILLHMGWATENELRKIDNKPSETIIERAIQIALAGENINAIKWLSRYFTITEWFIIYLNIRNKPNMAEIELMAYRKSSHLKNSGGTELILNTKNYINHVVQYGIMDDIMKLLSHKFISHNELWNLSRKYSRSDILLFLSNNCQGDDFTITTRHMFDIDNFCDNLEMVELWIRYFYHTASSNKTAWRIDIQKYRENLIIKSGIETWLKIVPTILKCVKTFTSPHIFSLLSIIFFILHYDVTLFDVYSNKFDNEQLMYIINQACKSQKTKMAIKCIKKLAEYYSTKEFRYSELET